MVLVLFVWLTLIDKMAKVKVEVELAQFVEDTRRQIINAMTTYSAKIAAVVKDTAIEDLDEKRTTPKIGGSPLVDSFGYSIKAPNFFEVHSVVFAGGPRAPYAEWVDIGHTLRNGMWWEGHQFMKAGADEGEKQADEIVRQEMSRVGVKNFRSPTGISNSYGQEI